MPFPDETKRNSPYYNIINEDINKIIKQTFPMSSTAQFYNFQQNCPTTQPERLFYNITNNNILPNRLNYVNFNTQ